MIGITRKQLRELHEEAQKLRELGAVTVLPPEPKKTGVTAFLYPERSAKGVFGEALYADVLFSPTNYPTGSSVEELILGSEAWFQIADKDGNALAMHRVREVKSFEIHPV